MTQKVLFDPGFTPLVYSFSENLDAIETFMRNIKLPNQRRFRFQSFQPQIIALTKNSVAFYLGCLMWAKYIKEVHPEAEIENNPFFGVDLNNQPLQEEDFYKEVNLFISYLSKYSKDCKFYLGKEQKFPENWSEIAKTYKDFLELNQSFIKTKYAKDIKLPQNITQIISSTNEHNKNLIDNAIKNNQIDLLLNA